MSLSNKLKDYVFTEVTLERVDLREKVVSQDEVREAVRELKNSFKTTGMWTRDGALMFIDKIFGKELI